MRNLLPILILLLPLSGKTQRNDSLLSYFYRHHLLLPSQVMQSKELDQQIVNDYSLELKEAKTKEEKERIHKTIDAIRERGFFTLPGRNEGPVEWADTINTLMTQLVPSIRGSFSYSILTFSAHYTDSDRLYRRVPIQDLLQYISQFGRAGLATRKEVERVSAFIRDSSVIDSFSTVEALIHAHGLFEAFSLKRVMKQTNKLMQVGLLDSAAAKELLQMAEDSVLTSTEPFLRRAKGVVIINPDSLSDDPDQYFEDLHRRLAALSPDFRFTDFRYRVELDKEQSFDTFRTYRVVASLRHSGRDYAFESYYNPDWMKEGRLKNFGKFDTDYYQIFNKILADQNSDLRLHLFRPHQMDYVPGWQLASGKTLLGFVLLTREQEAELESGYLPVNREDYSGRITTNKVWQAFELYYTLGLFSHLKPDTIAAVRNLIYQKSFDHYSDLLSLFPDLVFEIDLEYGVGDHQYREITQQIAKRSKGAFRPQQIVDGYTYKTGKNFLYGFTLNGKVYRTRLAQEDDWLDPGFWDLIVKAMKEQDPKGAFYELYPNDGMRVVYLTHEQHRQLKASGLLELEPLKED